MRFPWVLNVFSQDIPGKANAFLSLNTAKCCASCPGFIAFRCPDPNLSGPSRKCVSKNVQSLYRGFLWAQKHRFAISNQRVVLYVFAKPSETLRAVRSEIILNLQFDYQVILLLLTVIHPYPQQHFFVIKPPGPANQDDCINVCRNSQSVIYLILYTP